MNRTDFQQLADVRMDEAGLLLAHGKYDGAYYLAGYAVECGLKACIAKLTNQHDFPDKLFAQQCFTHVLEDLVKLAGLEAERNAANAADPVFRGNWVTVRKWTESSRYARYSAAEAHALFDAVADAAHGVLPWVRLRW